MPTLDTSQGCTSVPHPSSIASDFSVLILEKGPVQNHRVSTVEDPEVAVIGDHEVQDAIRG
ncbi:hypothetical protein N7519_006345 [Penicillium mononematosum]|uniref:uncharacterized protein n=1 Tax=Penicillium mononematosum TaxID=268346 RepID=UPI0025497D99|nr:uncharacterized protein N7519_006345 [Penicillium mononematosum]KAJ6185044.1 hypothetical protein N7519_006345 [Penicillium mononematosum]